MSDWYEPIDIDAVIARAEIDAAYAAMLREQTNAELHQLYTEPETCGDCGTVMLTDEWDNEYCPQCDT